MTPHMFGQAQAGRADEHITIKLQPQVFESFLIGDLGVIAVADPLATGRMTRKSVRRYPRH
jgi:hypothetical protein